jgi:DNA uptake protein ComE-like DNA-binding protein
MKDTVALLLDRVGPLVALAATMLFVHLALAQSPATSTHPPPTVSPAAPTGMAAQSPSQPPAPTRNETPAGHPATGQTAKPDPRTGPTAPVKKVDLNNASLAELKTLPMVTDEYAKKIIAHRPYMAKGELVTKAGLPEGVYVAVRRKIVLKTPKVSAPKQSAPKS